jgi:BirA family biotin operon repressor/biotin-[acetyl-CoA-carboxylase] ligase
MEMSAEATRVKFVVLGIGVNLNVERESFPEEFRHLATSLRSHIGAEVDRAGFCRRLYGKLEQVLDAHARGGFAAVRPRFEARFRMPGRPVRVLQMNGSELAGVARAIASDGALEVQQSDGEIVRVIAGDVTLAQKETLT